MRNLFVLAAFAIILSLPILSCVQRLSGEGPIVTQEFDLGTVHSIGLGVSAKVYLEKGSSGKVVIEGQQNIIDDLKKDVRNGKWNIKFNSRNVGNYKNLVITITTDEVRELAIGGSGSILARDDFDMDDLEIAIAGSGDVEIGGTADDLEISIAGSGDVKTGDLKVENCEVSIAGSGNAYIEVREDMEVSIAGSGSVYYKGRPRLSTSIAGSGSVKTMD